jgi:hypothetical protein
VDVKWQLTGISIHSSCMYNRDDGVKIHMNRAEKQTDADKFKKKLSECF